jgi:hypothetical protein
LRHGFLSLLYGTVYIGHQPFQIVLGCLKRWPKRRSYFAGGPPNYLQLQADQRLDDQHHLH